MSAITSGIFNFADKVNMTALSHRDKRNQVLSSNIANAETPGYRALGYDFESQLQTVAKVNDALPVKVSHPRHMRHQFATADGRIKPDVYIRPTESVGEDGNTVDLDKEMASLAQNQILFRTAVELLNRKIGTLKYAINGGR